jgi:hypothetical protein
MPARAKHWAHRLPHHHYQYRHDLALQLHRLIHHAIQTTRTLITYIPPRYPIPTLTAQLPQTLLLP